MKIRRTTMKIRVSNMSHVLYKDHYENKGVKPASCFIYKDHYENKTRDRFDTLIFMVVLI